MDSNYLHNLFINEVKGALNSGGGGGSGGNVKIPTKLSELENDLWYKKATEVATLTLEDFTFYAAFMASSIDKPIDFDIKKVGFAIHANIDGRDAGISSDEEDDVDYFTTDYGRGVYFRMTGIEITDGFVFSEDADDYIASDGKIHIVMHENPPRDLIAFFNFTLNSIDEKKIPIEYCDTTEIENAIGALTEEVWEL